MFKSYSILLTIGGKIAGLTHLKWAKIGTQYN